jgi:FixJ family two-component response regulator
MTPVLNSKHVFIIEDNEAMLELIKFMVNELGYTAHCYSSAYDFLREISFLPLAVLITDLNMPGITGLQLQNVLIKIKYKIPIVFVTGDGSIPKSVSAMKKGAIDFLTKPIVIKDLKKALESGFLLAEENSKIHFKKDKLYRQLGKLTPRERDVFNLLTKGFNNLEMANELSIAMATVKQYKYSLMNKLNISTLAELIDLSN